MIVKSIWVYRCRVDFDFAQHGLTYHDAYGYFASTSNRDFMRQFLLSHGIHTFI